MKLLRQKERALTWCELQMRNLEEGNLTLFNLTGVLTPGSSFCLDWESRVLRIVN